MAMENTEYRGTAANRGQGLDPRHPPTAAVGGTGRDIVRFLEGNGGEALLSDVAAHMPGADRRELQAAVDALKEARIVDVVPGHDEPRVRLLLPVKRNPHLEA